MVLLLLHLGPLPSAIPEQEWALMLLLGRLGRCVSPLLQKSPQVPGEERGNVFEVRIFPLCRKKEKIS